MLRLNACQAGRWTVLLLFVILQRPARAQEEPETTARIRAAIARFEGKNHAPDAQEELAGIGAPAIPYLLEAMRSVSSGFDNALSTFSKMGDTAHEALARDALRELLAMARNRDLPDPPGWGRRSSSPRERILYTLTLESWDWATERMVGSVLEILRDASEPEEIRELALRVLDKPRNRPDRSASVRGPLVGVLAGIVEDAGAPDSLQRRAVERLSSLGEDERVAALVQHGDDSVRAAAVGVTMRKKQAEQKEPTERGFRKLIEDDPCDPNVAEYLRGVKLVPNRGTQDALTESVKERLRAELAANPTAATALALAKVIQDQLSGTELQWSWFDSNSGYFPPMARECATETNVTFRAALEQGFALSRTGDGLRYFHRSGMGLAKPCLIQGDFERMNEVLRELGLDPIDPADRPFLHAPPKDWKRSWKQCSEPMRSGNCALELQVEFEGKGMPGVQLVLKECPAGPRGFHTFAIRTDTLFYAPQPIEPDHSYRGGSFGYESEYDRDGTRYLVTDSSGKARFERLPKISFQLEMLVPTANLDVPARRFELWMEEASGQWQPQLWGTASADALLSNLRLEESQTLRLPRFQVRRCNEFHVKPWSAVDPTSFTLSWKAPEGVPQDDLFYELSMVLIAPSLVQWAQLDSFPRIAESTTTLFQPSAEIGREGVVGLRLAPGNIYWFEVRTFVGKDWLETTAPLPVYVPLPGLQRHAPDAPEDYVPFIVTEGGWVPEEYRDARVRERLERWIEDHPDAFAREYAQVCLAYVEAVAGNAAAAELLLESLIADLPSGNLVRSTAQRLLSQLAQGSLPDRLCFTLSDS